MARRLFGDTHYVWLLAGSVECSRILDQGTRHHLLGPAAGATAMPAVRQDPHQVRHGDDGYRSPGEPRYADLAVRHACRQGRRVLQRSTVVLFRRVLGVLRFEAGRRTGGAAQARDQEPQDQDFACHCGVLHLYGRGRATHLTPVVHVHALRAGFGRDLLHHSGDRCRQRRNDHHGRARSVFLQGRVREPIGGGLQLRRRCDLRDGYALEERKACGLHQQHREDRRRSGDRGLLRLGVAHRGAQRHRGDEPLGRHLFGSRPRLVVQLLDHDPEHHPRAAAEAMGRPAHDLCRKHRRQDHVRIAERRGHGPRRLAGCGLTHGHRMRHLRGLHAAPRHEGDPRRPAVAAREGRPDEQGQRQVEELAEHDRVQHAPLPAGRRSDPSEHARRRPLRQLGRGQRGGPPHRLCDVCHADVLRSRHRRQQVPGPNSAACRFLLRWRRVGCCVAVELGCGYGLRRHCLRRGRFPPRVQEDRDAGSRAVEGVEGARQRGGAQDAEEREDAVQGDEASCDGLGGREEVPRRQDDVGLEARRREEAHIRRGGELADVFSGDGVGQGLVVPGAPHGHR
mmetsp:Transcript_113780/g.328554  ORF Transcript_113780/g.328554 Transcript_113780/m.328554 type:complete len:566 (+) Transcript_113780:4551-6248(+)